MNDKYIMALDQGTTSSRCIIYDRDGRQVSVAQKEFDQLFPRAGWVEHDAMQIWRTQMGVATKAIGKAKLHPDQIAGIGITNQRETTVVWDRQTGLPVCNAIVWQCRRTAALCDRLKEEGLTETWRGKTGLLIDAYFSATKLAWILEHVEGVREKAERGEVLFGTVETWLIWKMTGGRVHVTDYSNASRTMMFNIHTLRWDEDILQRLDIPRSMLPEVKDSSAVYGYTDPELFGIAIPIAGAAGDQQAALFGQAAFRKGQAKNTYGTGGFMLVNTGESVIPSKNRLLNTIAWGLDGKITYALEGSVFVSGAAVKWLRDELKLIDTAAETEALARTVPDTQGVYMVPAFTGLGAPWWDPYARGSILGLTRGTGRAHLVRAVLESMVYQTCDLTRAMTDDLGEKIGMFKVDGGAAANDFLLEFQADMLGQPVFRPECIETTSLGAAYLAGLAVGYWDSPEEILNCWRLQQRFDPGMDDRSRMERMKGWHRAVERSMGWESPE